MLRPGDNVVWLAVDDVIDDSNPLGLPGGEHHDQRPGTASIGSESCPAATADGACRLGFVANDIAVTANGDFLAANPAARALFEQVKISVIDVSSQSLRYEHGENTTADVERHAAEWIAANRNLADQWLGAARTATQ